MRLKDIIGMNKEYYYIYNTPIGKLLIEQEGEGISKILTVNGNDIGNDCILEETLLIQNAYKQLEEYFQGERTMFDLPLVLHGTDFQLKVWQELMKIPYGETCSYIDIANRVNCPKGARAVGNANNRNNIMIVIPCHRVIGKNGNLTGYAGGLDIKQYLLDLESKSF